MLLVMCVHVKVAMAVQSKGCFDVASDNTDTSISRKYIFSSII